jgi:alcohol dehydrogenase class IV
LSALGDPEPAAELDPVEWPTGIAEFRSQPGLRAVVSGVGSVRQRLAEELRRNDATRPMIVCGENLARSRVLELVRKAAGCDVSVFPGSRPHTPSEVVDAGAAMAREHGADALIAVGGGSAIDGAKGVARLVASGTERVADLPPTDFQHLGETARTTGLRPMPLVTVTTTLSFAEFLPFWGARDERSRRKVPYHDDGTALRTIFLDGEIAADTPDDLWAQTGVKALDDAVSAFCRAVGPEPFGDPVLVDAVAALGDKLPASMGRERAAERQRVLIATWMTKIGLPRLGPVATSAWFSTAARHALGGVLALPHGVGSCVALGPALRFHAEATRERQAMLAQAIGWPGADDPAPLARGIGNLLGRLRVPTHLAPLGVSARDLDDVVEHVLEEAPLLGPRVQVRRVCDEML